MQKYTIYSIRGFLSRISRHTPVQKAASRHSLWETRLPRLAHGIPSRAVRVSHTRDTGHPQTFLTLASCTNCFFRLPPIGTEKEKCIFAARNPLVQRTLKKEMEIKKRIVTTLLLLATLLTVTNAMVPHHHHAKGVICLKQDLAAMQTCPMHHVPHHHSDSDTCCNDQCSTRFQSPSPSCTPLISPLYPLLFEGNIPEFTPYCIELANERHIDGHEPLGNDNYARTIALRAPPASYSRL